TQTRPPSSQNGATVLQAACTAPPHPRRVVTATSHHGRHTMARMFPINGPAPPGPRPGPGEVAEPCGHRRSVTLPGGPLVVAGVSGSPGSVHALRYAAELARARGAALVPVLAWVPPGGDLAEHKHPDPELRRLWQQDAWQRLRGALGTAFGGLPPGLRTWPLVLRGQAGPQLVSLARQPGDLLVIGAGRRTPPTRLVGCPAARPRPAPAPPPLPPPPPPRPAP